ncbi:TadE family protein [Anaerostipes sp. MSJ-23]|uniref:TadE family protein n=1 Tax=unclassified Anaerostipes TaxID=2635253 RepID=UPI001C112AC6|nr:TadE family protein [Anaerostipes sp. MSJ-23]MBU5459916.1 pilus assembly protein [Anaerostipes sp. MSJ-23]
MWTLEDGYITVETSLLLPVVFTIFLLFIFYACYFMNCGIICGTMENVALKAADTAMGNDYKTGKISYKEKNKESLYGEIFSNKNDYAGKVKEEIEENLKTHLFLENVEKVKVKCTDSEITVDVTANMEIPGTQLLELFQIKAFYYKGNYKVNNLTEIDQIRRWNVIERAMD